MRYLAQNSILPIISRVLPAVCFLILAVFPAAYGSEIPQPMELFFESEAMGLSVWAKGKSMLVKGELVDESTINVGGYPNVEKVFLIWSGETKRGASDFIGVAVKPPADSEKYIGANKHFKKNSAGQVYTCLADITDIYTGAGKYVIKGIRSDAVSRKRGKYEYSVAGYAIIIIYRDPKLNKVRTVHARADTLVLKPGEIHEVRLLEAGAGLIPRELIIIGGHGHKGNASANLINGISVSGGEDWDGSSGKFWDVDSFKIEADKFSTVEKGVVLGFDSLLQWIYPSAVIFTFEKGGDL